MMIWHLQQRQIWNKPKKDLLLRVDSIIPVKLRVTNEPILNEMSTNDECGSYVDDFVGISSSTAPRVTPRAPDGPLAAPVPVWSASSAVVLS